VIGLGRRPCAAHRAVLLDFAARRARGPAIGRALDHLDRCRACEQELAATTLVVHALRRLHAETMRAEPAPDGWTRLRARLAATRREPSRVLSGLPGIVVAAVAVTVLAGPGALAGGGRATVYNEAPRGAPPPHLVFEESRERALDAGLLPEPEIPRPYTGRRIAPPPITADLPLAMEGRVEWIEEVVATPVSPADDDHAVQRRAGRR
jgi:hypothetical protein